jgi:hypothetical protein
MSRIRPLIALLLAVSAAPVFAGEAADASMDILRETLRANKKAIVDVNLALSDAEAGQFWPVYDRYQKELTAVNDRLVKIVEEYTSSFQTLSDERAKELIEQYLAVDEDRAKIRRAYLPEFSKILPGRTVARFYQIENKIDVVLRYEMASTIPVIDEKR